jgi:hypothetical protein
MIEFSFKCDTEEELEIIRRFLTVSEFTVKNSENTVKNSENTVKNSEINVKNSEINVKNDEFTMNNDEKSEIRKQKKAEYDKQRYQDKKNFTVKNSEKSEISQEERENEKETEEKERTKEKEDKEKVKEKEELINIYAPEQKKAKTEKPVKHKYGNFQHVFLTDEDYQRLSDDFDDLPERIQRLDDYLENNPSKHYANHNLTIRNWANKDAKQMQMQPKQIPKEKTFRDLRIEMEQQEQKRQDNQDYFIDSFWRV